MCPATYKFKYKDFKCIKAMKKVFMIAIIQILIINVQYIIALNSIAEPKLKEHPVT